ILFDKNNNKLLSFHSNEMDASFSFKQSCNTTYHLKGYSEGYLIGELDLKTVNDLNAAPLEIVMNMSLDPSKESDLVVDVTETNVTEGIQVLNSYYNFNSDNLVYTVQIGAFQGKAQTDKFVKLSSLFNYLYNDGFNRYYSGVFESHLEAVNYIKLLKKAGYIDAFIVGLKGKQRF
ncbi:MAG: SPOR domain-containing protein, partial [Thiohalomonadales bacterium]